MTYATGTAPAGSAPPLAAICSSELKLAASPDDELAGSLLASRSLDTDS